MVIDAHCHLERDAFGEELDEVIARAFDAGLTHLVAVGASGVTAGAREAVALAERLDAVYATAGLHPHEAAKVTDGAVEQIAALIGHPKVVALGEIGLDYHYDLSPRDVQRDVFRRMLTLGRQRNVPVMLHTREAHADTLALLDEVGLPERGGVVHCFTEGPDEAAAYFARGLYLSIPGVVTFKKRAEALREAVLAAPLDRLLIETDSPYLAPVPHRGKRNEPAYLLHTAAAIGRLKGLTGEDVGRITAQNAMRLFGIDSEVKPALAYPIRHSLYVNLTSRCTLGCTFCPKIERRDWWVKGHWLRLGRDPSVADLLAAIGAELARRPELVEIVFVGLGEPTLRLDDPTEIARALRTEHAGRYRLRADTDGLANLVYGRNVAVELAEVLDAVCVSINAADAETYQKLCPSKYGAAAWEAAKSFAVCAREAGLEVTASVVGVPGLDLDACRRVAEELGATFRHRRYQQYG
jgi:TatD DNase family protein